MSLSRLAVSFIALAAAGCGSDSAPHAAEPLALRVVTFNTGSGVSTGLSQDGSANAGFGLVQSAIGDDWYSNGLAWPRIIEDTRAFFAEVQPDIVGFQEIFHPGKCPDIPAEFQIGFICETWQTGDPTVAQMVLGDGYQIACQIGKSDKCLAVRRAVGSIRGCAQDLCLDGLDGAEVPGCGSGSRVGRAIVDLAAGGEITVVNVHGTSGFLPSDRVCRSLQFAQVFEDLGDGNGRPAADGERVIVLGDFNTDPGRTVGGDVSAQVLVAATQPPSRFRFVSEATVDAAPTYLGVFNIDHVIAAGFTGSCWAAGVTPGHPPVTEFIYFDHTAIVCDVEEAPDDTT